MQNTTHSNRIIELARQKGIIRSLDLNDTGIPRAYLTRMVKTGRLEKTGRGIYQLPDIPQSENAGMEIIAAKIPQAVFCLLTALQFHQLTNQLPRQIWVTMPQGSHSPKITYPPITMIQCNSKHLEEGVEICRRNNRDFRIYNVEKTIVDCFKHRNKVGLDVALEALKEGLKRKNVTIDELWYFAKIARVTNVMRPYIEALT
jgi:predicted transcriptional regulator of viral defense system